MNVELIKSFKDSPVKLVAVSKTRSIEEIKALYDLGQKDFGENRVQELTSKIDQLPQDIIWHLIGHLQKNKIKYIAERVDWIHSVDSFKLLKKINAQAAKHDRVINVLFQFKIAQEDTKYGFDFDEFLDRINEIDISEYKHVNIAGVMGMASFVDDQAQVSNEFLELKRIYDVLKTTVFMNSEQFTEISMGMSGDYKIAIDIGSTMVRIGTLLFKKTSV